MSISKVQDQYEKFLTKRLNDLQLRELVKRPSSKIDFSSNDYLSLASDTDLINVSIRYLLQYGVGAKGVRLLISLQDIYLELENIIADKIGQQKAIIFSSAFQANSTLIPALLDKKVLKEPPLVFTDRYVHASIHVGCQLAKVKQQRYHHCDMNHLEYLLRRNKLSKAAKFIFSETVFSMEGSQTNIQDIVYLSKKYDAFLYLDEAHAIGVFGENGYGICEGKGNDVDIVLGTFGKAVGTFGGYVACSDTLYKYIINNCSGFIYSTALPPAIIGATTASLRKIETLSSERKKILFLAEYLRKQLNQMGLNTGLSNTHIIPIIVNDEKSALNLAAYLKEKDITVKAIRPPVVPSGTSRIRICINARHTMEDVKNLIREIKAWNKKLV